jgi:hypothetical protein
MRRRVLALRIVSLTFVVLALANAYWGRTHRPPEPPCNVVAKDASKPDSKEPVDHGTISPWIFVIGAVGFAAIGRIAARPVSGPVGGGSPHLIVGGFPRTGDAPPPPEGAAPLELGVFTQTVRSLIEAVRARIPATVQQQARTEVAVASAVQVQIALFVFLTVAFIALFYEFWGVYNNNDPWPLTFFVRCINNAASIQTLALTLVFAFILGQWFWFPTAEDRIPWRRPA